MKSKYFKTEELLPKGYTDLSVIDSRLIETIDWIREQLGRPIYINNYIFGGTNQYRGWRPDDCSVGARFSAHKEGLAVDFSVSDMTAQEVRGWLKINSNRLPYPIRLEEDVSWVHLDLKNSGRNKIEYFYE